MDKGTLFLVFCALILIVFASSSEYFTNQNQNQVVSFIISSLDKTTGSFNKNLKETYFAVDTMKKLGNVPPSKSSICDYAKETMSDVNIESIFYGVSIMENLGCGSDVSDRVEKTIISALSSSSLYDLVYAVGAVTNLKSQKHIKIDHSKLLPTIKLIIKLMDSEYGTWFLQQNQEEGSVYLSGLALSALAQLATNKEDLDLLDPVIEIIPALLENGDNNDETRLFFRHTDNSISSLKTTAFLIKGIADLAEATKQYIDITDEQIDLITTFILSQKFVSSLEDAHALILGLKALSSPAFKRPLVLSLNNTQIHATKEKDRETDLRIMVTDIWGKFAVPTKVYLARAYHSGKDEMALLSNQEVPLVEGQKNVFTLDFLAARPDPGAYILEFRVIPQEKKDKYQSIESALRRVQVVASVGLTDGFISVLDQSDRDTHGNAVPFQQGQTLSQPINVKGNQVIYFSFKLRNTASGRSVVAHQTFVKLTNVNNKESSYWIVPHTGQSYELHLSVSKIAQKFNYANGSYEIELLVGDSFISSSFRWVVAKANINFGGKSQSKPASANPFAIRPAIQHNFKPAAQLAPEYMTSIFTVLVIIPGVLFIILILRYGNFQNVPSGTAFIYTALFIGGVGLLLFLIMIYWFNLKLFTALGYGAFVSVPTIIFGNIVLKYYANIREAKKQKIQ